MDKSLSFFYIMKLITFTSSKKSIMTFFTIFAFFPEFPTNFECRACVDMSFGHDTFLRHIFNF